jgi:hypothetical protein
MSRDIFNPTWTVEALDALVDSILDKKTRRSVDPTKIWDSGLPDNIRKYVNERWGAGKRENAVTRRMNTLESAMSQIPSYFEAKWRISRVWEVVYRTDNYWDRPTVGYVACRHIEDARDLGLAKYMSVILCYTATPERGRIDAREKGPGDWDRARQMNMQVMVKMNEKIKEKQASLEALQAEIDKLVNARMYALEGLHNE